MSILLVGAGIAGLSAAIALQNNDISYDIIEKQPEWTHQGAGIALPANFTWALDQLNALESVNKYSHPITAMTFSTHTGEVLSHEAINEIHPDGAQFLSIPRADLHKALIEKLNNPDIYMGTTIQSMKEVESGVEVELSNGIKKKYDLVIGADGIHSQVRKILHGELSNEYIGISNWRAITEKPPGLDHPNFMLGDNGTLALLYPLKNNKSYIYLQTAESEKVPDNPSNRVNLIQSLFKDYEGLMPEVLASLTSNESIIPGWLESTQKVEWGRGRVLLIGDAAHACSPMLQQGGAQSCEDALVIAQEYAKGIKEGKSTLEIIEQFINRRDQRVKWVIETSDKKIKAAATLESILARNNSIRLNGAPNIQGFKYLMQNNP